MSNLLNTSRLMLTPEQINVACFPQALGVIYTTAYKTEYKTYKHSKIIDIISS